MIDLNAVSKEIEQSAQTRGYPAKIPEFDGHIAYNTDLSIDFEEGKFNDLIRDLTDYSFISEYPQSFGNGIKSLIKRLIIKCVRFYVVPIVEKQNFFNNVIKESLVQMHSYNNVIKESLVQMHSYTYVKNDELENLKKQIRNLEEEIELLYNIEFRDQL